MSAEQTQDLLIANLRQQEQNRLAAQLAVTASEAQNQRAAVAQVLRENEMAAQQRQRETVKMYEKQISELEERIACETSDRVIRLLRKQITDLEAKADSVIDGRDDVAILPASDAEPVYVREGSKFKKLEAAR